MKTAAAIILLSTTVARAANVRDADALLRGQSSAGAAIPPEYESFVNQPPMPPSMTAAAKDAERVIKEMVAEAAGGLPANEKPPFPVEDTAEAILREVIQSNINELKTGSTVDGVASEMMNRFDAVSAFVSRLVLFVVVSHLTSSPVPLPTARFLLV